MFRFNVYLSVLALVSTCAFAGERNIGLPDPALTPGAINPKVTQQNLPKTVCVPGYSKRIRPSESYTNKLKKRQIREYGYSDHSMHDYEEDHLIPLSIGGSPMNPKNLWPEPRYSKWNSEKKDKLEWHLHRELCKGKITLKQAQGAFFGNWGASFRKYFSSKLKFFKKGNIN